jgi:hypothetical protein
MPSDLHENRGGIPLDYAAPNVRPDRTTRIILLLLFTFLALGAFFIALVIYMSWID